MPNFVRQVGSAPQGAYVSRQVSVVSIFLYEEDFLGLSYGFRPGRGQHDALDTLYMGIKRRKVN
jgi:retron-type reverse transcriptase